MIGSNEVLSFINNKGLNNAIPYLVDVDYAVPTVEYVLKVFPKWWKEKLDDRNTGRYDYRWDCDNFALTYYVDIQWAHYNTKGSMAQGLSVGFLYYMAGAKTEGGGRGGHAINVALVGDGDGKRIIFIEPQLAARNEPCEIMLSEAEIASAWMIQI